MSCLLTMRHCRLQSSLLKLRARNFTCGTPLLRLNAPKFDEADLMASKLESKPYAAKKITKEWEWPDKSAEEMEKENQDRYEKLMKLSAALQGLLLLAGIGVAGTVYSKWPQIKGWWLTRDERVDDDAIEKLLKKKAKKTAAEFPVIPASEPGWEVPGLYFCGGDKKKDSACTTFPRRNPFFEGKYLRDVCLSTADDYPGNLAIDERGDLQRWDENECECILPDQDLVTVKESNCCAYAMNRRGEILVIPLNSDNLRLKNMVQKRSWIFPWKRYISYKLKLETKDCFKGKAEKKILQFDTGREHLVLISNAGKAYTCATGVSHPKDAKSFGQFGVPDVSQFDKFPPCNKLYEIELLNCELTEEKTVRRRVIKQVACGNYHTLARDSDGNLFVFGLNRNGQLGLPILYDAEQVSFPKKLNHFSSYFTRDTALRCVDVNCCGETSYVAMAASTYKGHKKSDQTPATKLTYFSFGNGQYGELGNGSFKNSQPEPSPIKVINELNVLNNVEEWSCGGRHVVCKMQSGDVLAWGCNDHGQLGNGKRIKQCKPIHIPQILGPGIKNTPEEVYNSKLLLKPQQWIATGESSSCIYWKK